MPGPRSSRRSGPERGTSPLKGLRRGRIDVPAGTGAAALPALFVVLFFLAPYGAAVLPSLASGPAILAARFRDGGLGRIVEFTLVQAAASAALSLAIGLPGAWLLGGTRLGERRLARAIVAVPFAMPPVLVVLGFVLFFGNAGWANKALQGLFHLEDTPLRILYRPGAIVLAHGFYNFPLVIRLAGDALASAKRAYGAAAASHGASPTAGFFLVYLPLALPAVATAALLAFLYSFTSFAIVLVLGGGPMASTIAVEIYRAAKVALDSTAAGTLAAAETAIALAVYVAYVKTERMAARFAGAYTDGSRGTGEGSPRPVQARRRGQAIPAVLYLGAAALFVLGPIGAVAAESFLARRGAGGLAFTLRWWKDAAASVLPATARSLVLAALASSISVAVASLAALAEWSARNAARLRGTGAPAAATGRTPAVARIVGALCSVPVASSGIVLAFGWTRLYGFGGGKAPILAAAALQACAALPFAFRSIRSGLAELSPSTAAAAESLGARPLVAGLSVALPAAGPSIRSAFAFSAAISLGELNAVLMLGMGDFTTLPILVYRAAGAYRYGAACAAGTVLALLCAGAFAASDLGGYRSERRSTQQ